jgi:hypothetical protein
VSRLDPVALKQGALVALLFAIPFSVGARLMYDHDPKSPWNSVLWLAALAGFTLGAGVAAWAQRTRFPLVHGLVCAGGTYLVAQAVFVVVKLARGGDPRWISIFFTFSAVLVAGLIGGGLGGALHKRGIMPSGRERS